MQHTIIIACIAYGEENLNEMSLLHVSWSSGFADTLKVYRARVGECMAICVQYSLITLKIIIYYRLSWIRSRVMALLLLKRIGNISRLFRRLKCIKTPLYVHASNGRRRRNDAVKKPLRNRFKVSYNRRVLKYTIMSRVLTNVCVWREGSVNTGKYDV